MRRTNKQLAMIGADATRRGEHDGRRIPGRVLGALPVILVAATAACNGDNLFSGDSPEMLPRVVSITAPETVVAGDTVSVRVDATASHGVAQIVLSLEGAIARDTVVDITPPKTQVGQVIRVPVPAVLLDTLVTVSASVADALGNSSRTRVLEIVAFGPPLVSSVLGPATVRAGDVLTVEAKVSGSRRVTRVDYAFNGALRKDTSITVNPAVKTVSQTLTVQLPAQLQGDTTLQVSVAAVDESGLRGSPTLLQIPLSLDPPVVDLLQAPSVVRAGDNLVLNVEASGQRALKQVEVQLTGAAPGPYEKTTIAAGGSRFSETISIHLPGTIDLNTCTEGSCTLTVRVLATDVSGAKSEVKSATVNVPAGPPVVLEVEAPATVLRNKLTPPIRVIAEGDRPLQELIVYLRGAVEEEQTIAVEPQTHSASTFIPGIQIPEAPEDETLTLHVAAKDIMGKISELKTVVILIVDS